MPDYNTALGIARALAAGAGDAPGQTHVDDWLRTHFDPNDIGPASTLFGRNKEVNHPTGVNVAGGGSLLNYDTAQAQLAQARKYDPSASLELVGDPGRENYGPEGNAINQYILHMDNSTLPKFAGEGIDTSKYGPLVGLSVNNAGDRMIDPRYVIHDPNYGDFTFQGNLKQASNDAPSAGIMGQLEKYMPTVVMTGLAAGAGAAAGPILGALVNPANFVKLGTGEMGGGGILGLLMNSLAGMTNIPGAGSMMNYVMQQMQRQQSGGP